MSGMPVWVTTGPLSLSQ